MMTMTSRMTPLAVALLAVATLAHAQAPDPWVGKRVFTKYGTVLKVGDNVIDDEGRATSLAVAGKDRKSSRVYRVEHVNGEWLWLQDETSGVAGWVQAKYVVAYDQAIEYFTNEIRANPQATTYCTRGLVWLARKEFDIAIADFNEAIRADPSEALYYSNRGIAWNRKKDHDRAIADYNEAIRLDPKFDSAYLNRGSAWRLKKEYDRAIADYNEAIRLDPKYVSAYRNRGNTWRAKKEYDRAIADYNETIRLDPKNTSAYYYRGLTWRAKKEYDRAIADYNETIRLDPKNAFAFVSRGIERMILRRKDAEADFQATLDLQEGNGDASIYAVIVGSLAARQRGDEDAAKKFLGGGAVKLDPSAWPFPVVRFLQGTLDEAGLMALAVDDNKRTVVRCYLGLDHMLKGRQAEALAHWQWVRDHGDPECGEYATALAELDRLAKP